MLMFITAAAQPPRRQSPRPPARRASSATTAKSRGRSTAAAAAAASDKPASPSAATKAQLPRRASLTVMAPPRAAVWLDEVRRGNTNAEGMLEVKNVAPGRHTLRVRAKGFAEQTRALLPAERGKISVSLKPTADPAELAFQEAEEASEKAAGEEARRAAAELYRRAIALRPRFAAAHLGLARVLLALNQTDDALAEIAAARRGRPVYPEASAVEGRILRATADEDAAIESYRRAIREAHGFQPEAYAGLGIVLEERGDYEGAVESYRKAVAQLSDTEPALYQLLGASLEKLEKWKEAVDAYEKYLELAPEGKFASAIRSIIDQLRVQAADEQPPQGTPPIR